MSTPYVRAPHQEGSGKSGSPAAPNAALLIDFDNVTMGMRSDLSRELKSLLNSDIIKGKVAVQRAYADWRRYPQYIVPLSEASIDLIFAPAYGSSKKNATDIRMAIDGVELVFTRPEIGTYILLTGDSDFSSLVLKLKEYGKYVIGVGIQESSSDILVQNCDEYYSYTNLAGLRKTTDADTEAVDPWLLVEKALEQMDQRNDVMRSDRLKQVMLEIDSGFDEAEYGFSKFSRFLTEASSKGLVELKRMDNGQYEVRPSSSGGGGGRRSSGGGGAGRSGRQDGGGGGGGAAASAPQPTRRTRGRATRSHGGRSGGSTAEAPPQSRKKSDGGSSPERESAPDDSGQETMDSAYGKLTDALERLVEDRGEPAIRDSDVKRKILEKDRSFDEAEVGFSKFSLFLQQAHDDGVIHLAQRESGNYVVSLPGDAAAASRPEPTEAAEPEEEERREPAGRSPATRRAPAEPSPDEDEEPEAEAADEADDESHREPAAPPPSEPSEPAAEPDREPATSAGRGLGPRRGERPGRRGRDRESGPPIFEGQVVGGSSKDDGGDDDESSDSDDAPPRGQDVQDRAAPSYGPGVRGPGSGMVTGPGSMGGAGTGTVVDPEELGFPSDREAIVHYLTNSYKGVGEKTAESLLDALGSDIFSALQRQPQRVRDVLPANRAEQFLEAWEDDLARRKANRR